MDFKSFPPACWHGVPFNNDCVQNAIVLVAYINNINHFMYTEIVHFLKRYSANN